MFKGSIRPLLKPLAAVLLCALPGPAQVLPPPAPAVTNSYYLTGNYIAILGRMPDPAGWIFWMSGLTGFNPSNGQVLITQQVLTYNFLTSMEFCDAHPGLCLIPPTECPFLATIYQTLWGAPLRQASTTTGSPATSARTAVRFRAVQHACR